MRVAGHASELTIDFFSRHDGFDFLDRRRPGVPRSLGVIEAEVFLENPKTFVGDVSEMRCGMAGIDAGQAFPLD